MRTLAIGDVHGSSAALDALLAALAPTPADRLVFLGDYVDRGPDTRGVLDRLIHIRATFPHAVFLGGNHELMMVRARSGHADRRMWLSVGGVQTLASYGGAAGRAARFDDVPPEHWAFLTEHLADWFETETHIFVHATVDPAKPLAEQPEGMLFWGFLDWPVRHVSGKTIVCGHTSQKSGQILDLGSTICVDTYAYGGGWLTGLDVDSLRYWQADVLGRVRAGQLPPR